jgi:hypothetical protein
VIVEPSRARVHRRRNSAGSDDGRNAGALPTRSTGLPRSLLADIDHEHRPVGAVETRRHLRSILTDKTIGEAGTEREVVSWTRCRWSPRRWPTYGEVRRQGIDLDEFDRSVQAAHERWVAERDHA